MTTDWSDPEPNDSPETAVPSGIFSGQLWLGFAAPMSTIATNTDVDYYVFKTGDAASLMGGGMQICWSFPGDLLNMYLWNVTNGQKGSLVKSSESTQAGCETLFANGTLAMSLQPMTTYLLEVRAAPGLNLNGMSGVYSA
jgi:hypothetical protein